MLRTWGQLCPPLPQRSTPQGIHRGGTGHPMQGWKHCQDGWRDLLVLVDALICTGVEAGVRG